MNYDGACSPPRFCTLCVPSPMSLHGQALNAVSEESPVRLHMVYSCCTLRALSAQGEALKASACREKGAFSPHLFRTCCVLLATTGRTFGSSTEGLSVARAAASAAVVCVSTYLHVLVVPRHSEVRWWWPKGEFGRLPWSTNGAVLAVFGVLGSGVATTTANGVAATARRCCLSRGSFV